MDISIIKAQETNAVTGIHIGDPSAKPIVEFMNLRCPYCRQWFEESLPILGEAVAAGKLRRVIKLFDKEKESLQRGNVMHRFVSSTDPQATSAEITKIYQTQDEWGHLSLPEKLQEIAELRLEHPEVSLKELGEMIPSGAISKSGINHRIRKINEFADHLREQVS